LNAGATMAGSSKAGFLAEAAKDSRSWKGERVVQDNDRA
jgi:hypothetical protein